jgi:hypothetical protein
MLHCKRFLSLTFHAAGANQTLSEKEQLLLKWEYIYFGDEIMPYLCLCQNKGNPPNGFGIPSPEMYLVLK